MLDIDHFKSVNDAHEHPVGDKALCLVAETLRQNKRDYDLVGRWGRRISGPFAKDVTGRRPDNCRTVSGRH